MIVWVSNILDICNICIVYIRNDLQMTSLGASCVQDSRAPVRTGSLLSAEEIQQLRTLPPSVQLRRKGLYSARKGWSHSEDDAMLRAFLWCVMNSIFVHLLLCMHARCDTPDCCHTPTADGCCLMDR